MLVHQIRITNLFLTCIGHNLHHLHFYCVYKEHLGNYVNTYHLNFIPQIMTIDQASETIPLCSKFL